MSQKLIASLKSPSGRYSAKVFHSPAKGEFRSCFFVEGVRHDYADAFTFSWAEAIEETAHSLSRADETDAEAKARAQHH